MRYGILVCLLGLAIALDLFVLVATSDDAFGSFDPLHPATLLPIAAHEMHAVATATGEFMRDLLAWFTAPHHPRFAEPPPQ